ncbi:beta-ketoacyl synthase N-terminal-like domain-containing protein [Micromonospora sp. NPDC049044]|uniref:type I polyketide synthase n=1 Tax=unclassified Micromonospora TaxID=2617518 RepID=UPI00340AF871
MSSDEQLKAALTTLRDLRRKIDDLERSRREEIAIVGMSCRLPGDVDSPEALWHLLNSKVDAVTEVPASRWSTDAFYDPDPKTPGRMTARHGGFLSRVDEFDPYFFGISPREVQDMDPQQRLFLEVAWEAIEDAGITRDQLRGSPTGVFVGANAGDFLQLQLRDPAQISTYTSAGGANSLIPNRLSYLYDLRGPSMTVDTACSSALVALHLAAQSLRAGECDSAVVGGLNLMFSPTTTLGFAKLGALAQDGRCKTFDSRADGYVRSEGVTVLVVKRVSDALAAGDRIWAVLRGSAVNQDGLTNGITAPNGKSQREVITQALRNARLDPARVTLIEAHGTGTALGDPIETEALREVYGDRDGPPCALGSIKSNIGHVEAGAGLAGVLKAVLSIHGRAVAPNLHLQVLNPHIDLNGSRFFIPTEPQPWEVADDHRYAAVSAFGAGGTNAHVILGPVPPAESRPARAPEERPMVLPISAHTPEALTALTTAYRDALTAPWTDDRRFGDVAYTAATRRTRHPHRLAVVAGSREQAADRLTEWLDAGQAPGVVTGRASAQAPLGPVFAFAGHGTQRPGMGRDLMRDCPDFRAAATECDEVLASMLGRSVLAEVHRPDLRELPDDVTVIQPALFALGVALAARWRAHGVEPGVMLGHSTGEITAAYVAGALSLTDAARIICVRAELLDRLRGAGSLLVVGLSIDEADALLDGRRDRVGVAVSNSPRSTVLSGETPVLEQIADELRARNVFCRAMPNSVAGHGPRVEPLRAEFLERLAGVRPRAARIPIYSTVTGKVGDGTDLDVDYWYRNLREPVLFWDALNGLVAAGHDTVVEISPHPMLLNAVEQAFEEAGRVGSGIASMHREVPEAESVPLGLATMFARGSSIALPVAPDARSVPLPAYAWQRERFPLRDVTAMFFTGPVEDGAAVVEAGPSKPEPDHQPAADLPTDPFERHEVVRRAVVEAVAEVLAFDPGRIDGEAGFFQLGMDSLMAIKVRRQLEARFRLRLGTPVMFEHPTVDALTDHLTGLLGEPTVGAPVHVSPPDDASEQAIDEMTERELIELLGDEIRTAQQARGSE